MMKGEYGVISIHFEAKQDCQQLYEKITYYFNHYNHIGLNGVVQTDEKEKITIAYEDEDSFTNSFQPLLVSTLTQHIISTKEEHWMNEIIEKIFFFTDPEEKIQILAIARSILEGDRLDIPNITPFFQRDSYIYEAVSDNLEMGTTFYYDPFLTFRLKRYGEMLIDCVEIAIDEYLLEQEYQTIIENLRYFLRTESSKCEVVHVVYNGAFTFYDKNYQKLSRNYISANLEEHLLFEGDLDIDEIVISPLVSLAPKFVHVYSNEEDHGVILTIQAIFEERVFVHSLATFQAKAHLL